jgi:putative transposase
VAAGGMPDHSHWLIRCHPSKALADVMRVVKSRSSGWIHETLGEISGFAWQNSYGGFSVSQSAVDAVRAYIANQEEHHRTISFQEEYIAFLEKHGIEYDPKYLWLDADE